MSQNGKPDCSWELALLSVVAAGIKHKLHNNIPLSSSQRQIYDQFRNYFENTEHQVRQ